MTFHYDLDPKTRFVVLYQDAKMKSTRISKLTGVPLRTVQDWIQKLENNIDIFQHESKNLAMKIDDQVRESIVDDTKVAPTTSSTRKIGARYNVSHTAVRNVLIEEGFQFRKLPKKASLTEEEMENRVSYCKDMLKYKCKQIKRCFFSDEMGIRLTELSKGDKGWMQPQKKLKVERVDKDVKLNCWGAISWQGATSLHIFSDNLKNPIYQNIVENHVMEMEELYEDGELYFMQDNHKAHSPLDIIEKHKRIQMVDFPTYSPDLNPIENVWSTLKHRVACDDPKTEDDLVHSLLENWQEITQVEILRPYLQTLEGRYKECLEKQGQSLPY